MTVLSVTGTTAAQEPSNAVPAAAFTVDPDPPTAGQPATLDASTSSDPDGDPLTFAWDVDGDGTDDVTGVQITHTFPLRGPVSVRLTVSDGQGGTDTEARTLDVNGAPQAGTITVTAPSQPVVGASWTFQLAASDPDGDSLTTTWELGDGTQRSGTQVTHVYDAPGTYDVVATVTDPAGATDSESTQVTVQNRAPTAHLVVPTTDVTAGEPVTFDASGSSDPDGQALSYSWDIDGDGVAEATTASATYQTAYEDNTVGRDPYPATVTVSDGELEATSPPVEVTVANAAPTASFGFAPADVTTATDVTFDASPSSDVEPGELAASWDLGDGTTAQGTTVTHRYTRPGTYRVTLTVTDDDGATTSTTRDVEVANAPPVLVLQPDDPQTRPGEALVLDASGSYDPDGTPLSFAWSGVQQLPGTGPTYAVRYDTEGTYEVTVTVTDADGVSVSATVRILVDSDLVFRVAGGGRVETSVALSKHAFRSAGTAILARADQFPDALAASALAAAVDGPILLTASDTLSEPTAAELVRLGVTHTYLAGGESALSPAIVTELESRGVRVTRLAGNDRYATAAAIADELVRLGGRVDEAIVALGAHPDPSRAWPDALVAGNLATTAGIPVLLTAPDGLPSATASALGRVLTGKRVWIQGGESAVSPRVESQLSARGYDVRRLAGPSRYATGVVVADEARRRGASADPVVLASGLNFPDALAATVTAWKLGGVLLLVDPTDLRNSDATYGWLRFHRDAVDTVVIAGGLAAVSDFVRAQTEDRIQDGTRN